MQLLYELNGAASSIGGLFFGLWLIPMGYVVYKYKVMPVALGWVLMVGGVAYVINTYLDQIVSDPSATLSAVLVGVANFREFWILGYLLIFGIRQADRVSPATPVPADRSMSSRA